MRRSLPVGRQGQGTHWEGVGEGGGTWPVGDHVVGVRGEIPGQGHLSVYRPVNKIINTVKYKIIHI